MQRLYLFHGRLALHDSPLKLEAIVSSLNSSVDLLGLLWLTEKIGLKRNVLDCERFVLAAFKGRPDRGEIPLAVLLCCRGRAAQWVCDNYHVSITVREHAMTYAQYDQAHPSDAERQHNPSCVQDQLWQHAIDSDVDRTALDMLRELHDGVLDEGLAAAYGKSVNWNVDGKHFED